MYTELTFSFAVICSHHIMQCNCKSIVFDSLYLALCNKTSQILASKFFQRSGQMFSKDEPELQNLVKERTNSNCEFELFSIKLLLTKGKFTIYELLH